MPVVLQNMRNELLPGLWEIRSMAVPSQWDKLFQLQAIENEKAAANLFNAALTSKVGVAEVAMAAVAVTLAKNPVVSRRFWKK